MKLLTLIKLMNENEISRIVVDSAFRVHNTLGPGLLETVYRAALAFELRQRGLSVVVERGIDRKSVV